MSDSGYQVCLILRTCQSEFGPLLGLPDDDVALGLNMFAKQVSLFFFGIPDVFYGKLSDASSGFALHQILNAAKQVLA